MTNEAMGRDKPRRAEGKDGPRAERERNRRDEAEG